MTTTLCLNSNSWMDGTDGWKEGREGILILGRMDDERERGKERQRKGHKASVYILELLFALLSQNFSSTVILSLGVIIRG